MFNLLYGKSASGKSYHLDKIDKTIVIRGGDLLVSTSQRNTLIIDDACWLTNKLEELLKAINAFNFECYFDAKVIDVVVVMNKIVFKFEGDKTLSESQMCFMKVIVELDVFKGTSLKIDDPYKGLTWNQVEVYNQELKRRSIDRKWVRVWVASSSPYALLSLHEVLLSGGLKVRHYIAYAKFINGTKRFHVSDDGV